LPWPTWPRRKTRQACAARRPPSRRSSPTRRPAASRPSASWWPASRKAIRRGIEKESLRATPTGALAATPHPHGLGSALTHPHITTDYSESQLELITGVHATPETCLEELMRIHQATVRALGDEMLWVSSMPCNLPADETIPIGRYGSSNVGRAKSVYRMGLAHRYGRRMQTISGIHYNWSMPGVSSDGYFALIRNFRRHAFLLLYLFGASPAPARPSWPAASTSCRRSPTAPCTCRTAPRCAWAGSATRATRRPAWRSATTAWTATPPRCRRR
jgi:hypothetical protein